MIGVGLQTSMWESSGAEKTFKELSCDAWEEGVESKPEWRQFVFKVRDLSMIIPQERKTSKKATEEMEP